VIVWLLLYEIPEALYHYGFVLLVSNICFIIVIIIPLTRMRAVCYFIKEKYATTPNTHPHSYIFLLERLSMQSDNIAANNHCSLPPSLLPVGCGLHAAVRKVCSMELDYLYGEV
jgi:hypothetical protein